MVVMGHVGLGHLWNVKLTVLVLAVLNVATLAIAVVLVFGVSNANCPWNLSIGAITMASGAGVRVVWMIGMAIAQAAVASAMIREGDDSVPSVDSRVIISYRRSWYRRWLWWSRVGTIVSVIQLFGFCYYAWFLARNVSIDNRLVMFCLREGEGDIEQKWLMGLMFLLPTLGGIILAAQCCVGSDVLAWKLLYGTHYKAWTSHYRLMFDYGIRELLCCLGRERYMRVYEEDEVDSVAALLGDLIAYRAVGTSHLEVIAGVALLKEDNSKPSQTELPPAPNALIAEATVLHPYAVAAYTGPLLDVGRNPLLFPCTWLFRQGVLSPWTRNRRPALEGDNWWRGHAAAFLRFAELPPEALRQGRVLQTNREAVYFVVVLHQHRSVLVAIRGTESPEDLLTDGLSSESAFTESDLCGILKNSTTISDRVRQEVLVTMPHFGHTGVIYAAKELAMQLDNLAESDESAEHGAVIDDRTGNQGREASLSPKKKGLLSSLLGSGGECEGYSLRLVGHSLGGAIAALTGLRLASRYPNLHVYTFGVLPCVDLVVAEACSPFTTSIIYNDEFSSCLSVSAIMRLRASALRALVSDSRTDADLVTKITRRLFKSSSAQVEGGSSGQFLQGICRRGSNALKGTEIYDEEEAVDLLRRSVSERYAEEQQVDEPSPSSLGSSENAMPTDTTGVGCTTSNLQEIWPVEMFVPGLVIHIIRTAGSSTWFTLPRVFNLSARSTSHERPQHKAVLRDRKHFREIRVSPTMFLDHMPWKCQYALNDILESLKL